MKKVFFWSLKLPVTQPFVVHYYGTCVRHGGDLKQDRRGGGGKAKQGDNHLGPLLTLVHFSNCYIIKWEEEEKKK